MIKVFLAYLFLFLSLIIFIIYLITEKINSLFVNNLLFSSSAIILLISVILFKIILSKNKKVTVTKSNKNQFKTVLEIDYQDLIITTNIITQSEEKDFEDVDINRVDRFLKLSRKKISNENRIYLSTILYVSKKEKKKYQSQKINLDKKTLEVKLYIQKKIYLYISDTSYFFDLNFLNN